MRRSRNAATATSLAALRTAGAAAPQRLACQPQRRETRLVGRLERQRGDSTRSRRRVGVAMRPGQASASEIGVRMSGHDICARTEPSR